MLVERRPEAERQQKGSTREIYWGQLEADTFSRDRKRKYLASWAGGLERIQ